MSKRFLKVALTLDDEKLLSFLLLGLAGSGAYKPLGKAGALELGVEGFLALGGSVGGGCNALWKPLCCTSPKMSSNKSADDEPVAPLSVATVEGRGGSSGLLSSIDVGADGEEGMGVVEAKVTGIFPVEFGGDAMPG